ncbi:hypothetical protein [Saccharibacillus kuerlensis]|uniref:Uncharacterized protein n=1 Tax=Saccharibacillus kuerlensis TaxID=459527 RepID=A0ABQ2L2R1_9BACL|nr:hypothetical protein [Saccharibacillus kuerlensis]GGO00629.1 hypothetical protein GCM10010969_22040 [Saccharibacillus kuerlensis]
MYRNRKAFYMIFAGLAAAIVVGWIFNTVYYRSHQLAKPVFLEHYVEVEASEGSIMHLYALENRSGSSPIAEVRLHGLETAHSVAIRRVDYGAQQLTAFQVSFNQKAVSEAAEKMKGNDADVLILNKVDLLYSDGTIEQANIGEIRLYAPEHEIAALSVPGGGGSSDNTGYEVLLAERDLQITDVDVFYAEQAGDRLEFYWGNKGQSKGKNEERTAEPDEDRQSIGIPLDEVKFPVQVKAGSTAVLRYRFRDRDPSDWTTVYHILPEIGFQTGKGSFRMRSNPIDDTPHPSREQVRRFVMEQGETS